MREAVQMIIVHVAGHNHIHRLEAVARLEFGKGVFDKAHSIVNRPGEYVRSAKIGAGCTVVDKERLPAVTDQGIKTRACLIRSYEVRRNRERLVFHRES